MPTISQSVIINADVETVFDLISRVEEFPLYASMLKEVREIGHHTYRWVARVRGLTLSWDSVITEFRRPTQLTWRSIRGFKNSGTYRPTNTPEGSRVDYRVQLSGRSFGWLDGNVGDPTRAHRCGFNSCESQGTARTRALDTFGKGT
jgi:uncharacterized membrane protein